MLVPVIRRITENKCFVERVFPVDGEWDVSVGDFVEPFDYLGKCRFSQNSMILPEKFKPINFTSPRKFYYKDTFIGKTGKDKIYAPYDGNLVENRDKKYVFEEIERDYSLLSGVWGNVKSLFENRSALIETQSRDILLSASTNVYVSGELVVFPNPSDILKKSYLENFIKDARKKIIYIGNNVSLDVVKRAYELGASAVLSGSVHSEVFEFAQKYNFGLGVFSGFGDIRTPEEVYKFLSSVSYRYVFFEGEKNILRVPVRQEDLSKVSVKIDKNNKKGLNEKIDPKYVKNIEKNMNVQVLQKPYFGWTGIVDSISESSIFVKFGLNDKSVEIQSPNFLIVE